MAKNALSFLQSASNDGHAKEPYEMSMVLGADRRSNFFFSPSAHLCAITYNWNIVECDVKQPIHSLTHPSKRTTKHKTLCQKAAFGTLIVVNCGHSLLKMVPCRSDWIPIEKNVKETAEFVLFI